jgi:hypothetical protein
MEWQRPWSGSANCEPGFSRIPNILASLARPDREDLRQCPGSTCHSRLQMRRSAIDQPDSKGNEDRLVPYVQFTLNSIGLRHLPISIVLSKLSLPPFASSGRSLSGAVASAASDYAYSSDKTSVCSSLPSDSSPPPTLLLSPASPPLPSAENIVSSPYAISEYRGSLVIARPAIQCLYNGKELLP